MESEQEYYDRLKAALSDKRSDVGLKVIGLADAAVAYHPGSARLWTLRGRLLQFAPEGSHYTLTDVLASFDRAVGADPSYVEAYEEIGYHYQLAGDAGRAEPAFRKAVGLGGGARSYAGLAWVLAETGRLREALQYTQPPACPHPNHPAIARTRAEIQARLNVS